MRLSISSTGKYHRINTTVTLIAFSANFKSFYCEARCVFECLTGNVEIAIIKPRVNGCLHWRMVWPFQWMQRFVNTDDLKSPLFPKFNLKKEQKFNESFVPHLWSLVVIIHEDETKKAEQNTYQWFDRNKLHFTPRNKTVLFSGCSFNLLNQVFFPALDL